MEDMSGKWVMNQELGAATNVYGRKWRTVDGRRSGSFYGTDYMAGDINPSEIMWWFPHVVEPSEAEAVRLNLRPWWKFW